MPFTASGEKYNIRLTKYNNWRKNNKQTVSSEEIITSIQTVAEITKKYAEFKINNRHYNYNKYSLNSDLILCSRYTWMYENKHIDSIYIYSSNNADGSISTFTSIIYIIRSMLITMSTLYLTATKFIYTDKLK